jgi:MprA protease rhombosortase-interaction domain-containing protein
MTTELVANEWLNSFLLFTIYLSSALVLLFIGKLGFKLRKNKIDINHELVEKDNLAFSFAYVGYFAGLILAVGSAIY